ncbi:ATPase, partial [Halobacteriales archaeon SW_7_71_33]
MEAEVEEASAACATVIDEISSAVIAEREFFEVVMTGVLGKGHVLLEDV